MSEIMGLNFDAQFLSTASFGLKALQNMFFFFYLSKAIFGNVFTC